MRAYDNLLHCARRNRDPAGGPSFEEAADAVWRAIRAEIGATSLPTSVRCLFPAGACTGLTERVMAYAADPSQPPASREAAFRAAEGLGSPRPAMETLAIAVLTNSDEHAAFQQKLRAWLGRANPAAVRSLLRQKAIPLEPLPPVETLYQVTGEERHIPLGFELCELLVKETAETVLPEDVLDVLRHPGDVPRLLGAMHLIPYILAREPEQVEAFRAGLHSLAADPRAYQWDYWPGGHYTYRIVVGEFAGMILQQICPASDDA